jgi:creatinine amidohydrolase
MLLQTSTWPEVEAYLARSKGALIPIGATEQHGPMGLIGTDAICAEEVARGAGEAAGVLVGPTISVGMSHHHMEFPGSMTLKPSTLILVIRDYVLSLVDHGLERFVFVNGHGGNVASTTAAFYEIHTTLRETRGAQAPDVRCLLVNWSQTETVVELCEKEFGDSEGSHATPSEVALAQYAYPDHIKTAALDPQVAPAGKFHDARNYRRRFPDGRIGSDSSLATPEIGGRILAAAVADVVKIYGEFLAEE